MKNRGCYLDQVGPLNTAMTKEDVQTLVAKWFPNVHNFVRSQGYGQQFDADSGKLLPWFRLLSRTGTTVTVVEAAHPSGEHLYQHKGRGKASAAESRLWFGALSIS